MSLLRRSLFEFQLRDDPCTCAALYDHHPAQHGAGADTSTRLQHLLPQDGRRDHIRAGVDTHGHALDQFW